MPRDHAHPAEMLNQLHNCVCSSTRTQTRLCSYRILSLASLATGQTSEVGSTKRWKHADRSLTMCGLCRACSTQHKQQKSIAHQVTACSSAQPSLALIPPPAVVQSWTKHNTLTLQQAAVEYEHRAYITRLFRDRSGAAARAHALGQAPTHTVPP